MDANLAYTSVTDDGLMLLAIGAPSLRVLRLGVNVGNNFVTGLYTDVGLATFARMRSDVRVEHVC